MKIGSVKERFGGKTSNRSFIYSGRFLTAVLISAAALFCISAVPFFIRAVQKQEFMLFFPDKSGTKLLREIRLAPRQDTPRDRVEEMIRQLIQGSTLLDPYPVFPYSTKINQVVVTEEGIYIDLSSEAVGTSLPIEKAVEILKQNIRKNFPGYDIMAVTVNGNDPVVVNKSLEEKDLEQ